MTKLIKNIIEENDHEKKIRYIFCVFLSLEALLICIGLTHYSPFFMFIKNNYGIKNNLILPDEIIRDIEATAGRCLLVISFTLFSIKFKAVYILYELIHMGLALYLISEMRFGFLGHYVELTISLLLFLRFFIYIFAIKKSRNEI